MGKNTNKQTYMQLLCNVDQAECFRHGIDAKTSTIKLEIDPQTLTEEQRNFVADQLYEGVRFPKEPAFYIIPPTMAGFLAAVDYGVAVKKQGSLLGAGQSGLGLASAGLGFGQSAALEMIRLSAVRTVVMQEQIGLAISTAQSEARNSAISKAIGQIKLGGSQK